MRHFATWPSRLPTWLSILVGVLLVAVVGAFDHLTGPELGFSIFYVLPIAWVTWRASARWGAAIGVLGAAVWYLNETLSGHSYSHPAVPLWNAVMRLGFFLVAVYAVDRTRKALERERGLSHTDALTQLANARGFYTGAAKEIGRARRCGAPLSVCYIDLDDFKRVNDTLGHLAGDEALRAIADALRRSMRVVDLPARLGGDEFVVLLPDTAADGACAAAVRMHSALLESALDRGLGVTFSIGVATFHEPPSCPEELVRRADQVMYAVKRSGKNAVRHEAAGPAPRCPSRAA